ncbi:MAG: hypothetical protein ABI680_02450 [Chthoniobacteraceae bacterium]
MTPADPNPFAPERLADAPFHFSAGTDWETILARLEAKGWRGAIIGAPGTGKSILLHQLSRHLEARGLAPRLFSLRTESGAAEKQAVLDAVRTFKAPDFLLLDGAELLTTKQWLPLHSAAVHCAGCVITIPRSGRLPAIFETQVTPAAIEAIVEDLTGGSLPPGEASSLFARHRGNLRNCLAELHERWAG